MLPFLSPEEKLKTYEDFNTKTRMRFRPLKSGDKNIDYVSVFSPKDYLRNINLMKPSAPEVAEPDATRVARTPQFVFPEEEPETEITPDKVSVKVKKGDSIKNYQENPFFKSIVNLNAPKNDKAYLIQMAYLESRFNPKANNKRGYIGAYQFGNTALKEVGMSSKSYMSNMNNQHEAALRLKESNLNSLRNYKKYIGKVVKGIRITASGLAAGAHLVGADAVKAFFDKGIVERDGNGTPITKYFKDFSHIL